MSRDLQQQAKELASRSYAFVVARDETTDGQRVFLAFHNELPGCMAQGATFEEAVANLEDARREYILSLLEDGLPVPEPASMATVTGASAGDALSHMDEYRGERLGEDREQGLEIRAEEPQIVLV